MSHPTRRTFIASTALAAAGVAASPLHAARRTESAPQVKSRAATQPAKKLNVGIVGVGGRGFGNLESVNKVETAQIVALCDVDVENLVHAARVIPNAKPYVDFRDLLQHKDLDAVLIATADHTHATITSAVLKAGKHVYCEKPLCHTMTEVKAITQLAHQANKVTQMGIQMHATDNYRRVVEIIRSGAIGNVHDVHIWHARTRRPFSTDIVPVPATLNYDLWVGPQSMRPFRRGYHPYSWRHWWDFGAAQIGDQSCHFLDVVFWSLGLTHPTRISAQGTEPPRSDMVCNYLTAQFIFPAQNGKPTVTLHWYDNPAKPPEHAQWKLNEKLAPEAIMFVGDQGMLCTNYDMHQLLPDDKFKNFTPPPQSIPKSQGHHREWVNACLANNPNLTGAPFHYGALLTNVSQLGIIAYRTGKTLEFDPDNFRFPNAPDAEKYMGYEYRSGWTL